MPETRGRGPSPALVSGTDLLEVSGDVVDEQPIRLLPSGEPGQQISGLAGSHCSAPDASSSASWKELDLESLSPEWKTRVASGNWHLLPASIGDGRQ
jgi:hypothetical protein